MLDGLQIIQRHITKRVEEELHRSGLMFRLFSRIKDNNSIHEKMTRKGYRENNRMMQDLIGIRVTTYFSDDVVLLFDHFSNFFEHVESVYDAPKTNEFNPIRRNLVCRMGDEAAETFADLRKLNPDIFNHIDSTFEIQFRTTLSEGWHEVEHIMRYKCSNDWKELEDESRMFNGIYATLETNDYTLKSMFDDIAYLHYKNQRWEAMLRAKFRLKFKLGHLGPELNQILNERPDIARELFKLNRIEIVSALVNSRIKLPISFNNIVYLCNHIYLKQRVIESLAPKIINEDLHHFFPSDQLSFS